MSVHDHGAASETPRFNLTAICSSSGVHGSGVDFREFKGLTEGQLEERKSLEQERATDRRYDLSFKIERTT
jgi:hypothetical protein